MERKRIPILNEKFDLAIFTHIIKRSILLSILVFITAMLGAFAYLRYTQPIFKSTSIIQLKNEGNATNSLLELTSVTEEVNCIQTIELIRSKEFLKRTFNKLPLDVSYFSQGTFLVFELYKTCPFSINYKVSNSQMYNLPIYVTFNTTGEATIKYTIGNNITEKKLTPNSFTNINGADILLNINDLEAIKQQTNQIKTESYYFTINDSESIYNKYSSQLSVSILNQEAKTITLSTTDNNAIKTSDIVNTIAEEFIKYDVEKKKESSQNILNFIEIQNKVIYVALDSIEEQLMQFRYTNQIRSDNKGESGVEDRYNDLLKKITEEIDNIEIELSSLKYFLDKVSKTPNIKVYELISILPPGNNGILTGLLGQLQASLNQRDIYLNNQTQNSFQIKVIEKQIEISKQTIIDLLQANYNRAQDKKEALLKKLSEYEIKIYGNTSTLDLDYLKLKRLYTINEGFYNKLLEKKAEYLVSQAGSVSQNTILENSVMPTSPIAPIRNSVLFLFFVIALVITFIISILRYLLFNEITSPDDIRLYTDVPVIGLVPIYKTKFPLSQLLVDIKPNSIFSEAFRSVRANLDFLKNITGPKTIAISSTISGEGKTFVGLNLAGIFAIQGKKVILIDLDLRKPRIHLCFGTDNSKGISTILIGKNKIEDCLKKSKLSNLDYITTGPVPPNPSELTAGNNFTELLSSLKELYDIVIIDTPPIGLVTDALNVYKNCDFPLYIIKANYSKRAFLYNLNHLHEDKHIENLSVILNGIDIKKSYGGYYYDYGYGNTDYHEDYYSESAKKKKRSFIKKMLSRL